MARTAITVTKLKLNQSSTSAAITQTTGDAALDHDIDATYSPRLHLTVHNSGVANGVAFSISLPAAKVAYDIAHTLNYTIDADEDMVIPLDVHPDLFQAGDNATQAILLSSADANFGDLKFAAITWGNTPVRF